MKTQSIWTKVLRALILVWGASAIPLTGAGKPLAQPFGDEEFFIISSMDAKKQQIVLKRPTEVTELIGVDAKTVYRDEDGKALEFQTFRAGDTVWVSFARSSDGTRIAARIRKGPMTVEELHRRYVPFQ